MQVSADERMIILGASHRRRMQQYHQHGAAAGENPYITTSSSSSSSHTAGTLMRTAGLQGTASLQQQQQQQQRAAGAPSSISCAPGLGASSQQQVGAATAYLSAPALQPPADAAAGQPQLAGTQEQLPPGSDAAPATAAAKQWQLPILEQPQQKAAWEEEGTLTAVLRQLGKCSTMDHQQQDTLQQQQQQDTAEELARCAPRSHHATSAAAAPMGHGNTVAAAAASVLGTHRQQTTARPGSPTSGRLADLGSSRSQDLPVADRSTTPVPVSISKPELEANYLRTEGLLLGTRWVKLQGADCCAQVMWPACDLVHVHCLLSMVCATGPCWVVCRQKTVRGLGSAAVALQHGQKSQCYAYAHRVFQAKALYQCKSIVTMLLSKQLFAPPTLLFTCCCLQGPHHCFGAGTLPAGRGVQWNCAQHHGRGRAVGGTQPCVCRDQRAAAAGHPLCQGGDGDSVVTPSMAIHSILNNHSSSTTMVV
jgi:hypothetical protein